MAISTAHTTPGRMFSPPVERGNKRRPESHRARGLLSCLVMYLATIGRACIVPYRGRSLPETVYRPLRGQEWEARSEDRIVVPARKPDVVCRHVYGRV